MERTDLSVKFPIGSKLPNFKLINVDNQQINSTEYFSSAKAALVIFTCNHCPYVKGTEASLNQTIREFESAGLKVLAISSNDAKQYPEDGFDKMQLKAKEMQLSYPYLYDESQEVAKIFDAACTPECYLFNDKLELVFHGTINDSPKDPTKATKNFLPDAISQILSGQKLNPSFVHPIGCSIKWK